MTLTVGSGFTGIGGLDLAFKRAGFDISWQIEIDEFCQKVLRKHTQEYWPTAKLHGDIKHAGKHNLNPVDVMVGGFPCQDTSNAGKGAGVKQGERSGLWFEFARIIGELRPRYVFVENVPGVLTRGATDVLASLAALGYDAEWGIVPASTFGAPHQRERWYVIAYPQSAGRQGVLLAETSVCRPAYEGWKLETPLDDVWDRLTQLESRLGQPSVFGNDDGLPAWVVRRRVVPQLQALGNAVVPQAVQPIAEVIYKHLVAAA